MKMKRIISMILTLCMALTLLPATALAADTVTVYAKVPEDWTGAYAYTWEPLAFGTWPGQMMTLGEDGWYTITMPASQTNLIINGGTSGYQTVDLTIEPGRDVWVTMTTITAGKYNAEISYGDFVAPDPEEPQVNYYVTGSAEVFGNWAECNKDGKMAQQGDIYVKTFVGVPAGDYSIQVNDGSWANSWGGNGENGNYDFTVAGDGATVTVEFDPATEAISVDATPGNHGAAPELVDGYYEIYTADQLYWFAEQVNGGSTSINGRLMANIVDNVNLMDETGSLNGGSFRAWTPVGYYESAFHDRSYTGTFDGNGKTVSGLYYLNTSKNDVGLFGYVGNSGVVKNVGVVDSYFRGGNWVGGVVGYNDDGTVSGCYNTGTVSGRSPVGGVVGGNDGTVTGCYNTGTVSGSYIVGGVVGSNSGTVSKCYNIGIVSSSGSDSDVGGVVGYNTGTVGICYNTGAISGSGSYSDVGGVVGENRNIITNCYNTGTVSGDEAGGIAGFSYFATISNCYTTFGRIYDYAYSTVVVNCYTYEDGFATGEITYLLQGDQPAHVWGQKIGVDLFPVFSQDRVYKDGDSYANCPGHSYENGFCVCCDLAQQTPINGDVYEISNAGQLYWFMGQVNAGTGKLNAKLVEDIVINENVLTAEGTLNKGSFRSWTPISNYGGTFDGNGKSISGLYLFDDSVYMGLFGEITSTGVVENLTLEASYLEGYVSQVDAKGLYQIGGIAGKNGGTVRDCNVKARVTGSDYRTGGVVGHNVGTTENCVFTGWVSGTSYVGGILGNNEGTLNMCYNAGTVSSSDSWIGGVVGSNTATVRNCYNTGAVTGGDYVGGIAGKNTAAIANCYHSGTVTARSYDRGIVGDNGSSNVSNCFYLEGSASSAGGGIAVTADRLASGEIAYLLQGTQGSQVWGQELGVESLPVFSKNRVYLYNGGYVFCAEHTYANGFCTTCGTQEKPELVDGVYEIYNAAQLYWFAEQVNGGSTSINGKLMANIVVNENVLKADGSLNGDGSNFRVWIPMGYYKSSEDYVNYAGTFDGNGKTVSGLYVNDSTNGYVGLFGRADGTIMNVGVVDSYLNGSGYVGGIVGANGGTVSGCYNFGTVSGCEDAGGIVGFNTGPNHWVSNMGCYGTVTNCYNGGTVSGNDTIGGVVGRNAYSVSNCYNTGIVSGSNDVGGVVGYNNLYNGTVRNCYNTGTVSGSNDVGGVVGSNDGTLSDCFTTFGSVYGMSMSMNKISNCYYLSDTEYSGRPVSAATAAQFASGKIAYLLQADQTEQIWGQAIGTDAFPVLGGSPVYQVSACNGAGTGYANDPDAVLDHKYQSSVLEPTCLEQGMTLHKCLWCNDWYVDDVKPTLGHSTYVNGFCTRCDGYEPAVLKDGVYEISNAGQLYWFAYWVNVGNTAVNGKLMENIVVNENVLTAEGELNGDGSNFRSWNGIGNGNKRYTGTFEGNGKTVSGLYIKGLFSSVGDGGFVQNLGVIGSYIISAGDHAGGVVCSNYGTINNCFNAGTVWVEYDESHSSIGGVAGTNNGIISNCYNTGIVIGNNHVGGVVGSNRYGAAIDGFMYGIVINCYNTGKVSGSAYVGGVIGENFNTVSNSYNTGNVSGVNRVGGVAGDNTGTISNSYNTGSVTGSGSYVGGVAGCNTGYLSECFYRTGCAVDGYKLVQFGEGAIASGEFTRDKQGQTQGKTTEQFASGEVCYLLFDSSPAKRNGTGARAWGQKLGTDVVPVFSEHKVYAAMKDGKLIFVNEKPDLPKVTGLITSFLEDGNVTVELLQDGQVKQTATVFGSNMRYEIDVMEAGSYTLRLSKANHAPVELAVTVEDGDVTMDVMLCPKGDVTGDGVVNIKDFQRLLRHVNKTNPLEDYTLACGDVTGDGVCNIKDFQRLLRHVNKTNPLF